VTETLLRLEMAHLPEGTFPESALEWPDGHLVDLLSHLGWRGASRYRLVKCTTGDLPPLLTLAYGAPNLLHAGPADPHRRQLL